ncbi:MAG: adenosylcobinamide-GDP ribazoletransferase [Thermodesulfobacteriota bacterium]
MLTKIISAIQFLTIIPLPVKAIHAAEDDLGRCSAYFPLAGLLQGVLLALVSAIFSPLFSGDIVAALQVATLALSNGGFHLDGLSDTVDALASRKSKEKMIAIMKDGAAGPIGVVSIVVIILFKYLLLKHAMSPPDLKAYVALILFPTVARWSMVPALFCAKSTRSDGLGKIFIERTGARELLIATGLVWSIIAAIFLTAPQLIVLPKIIVIFISMYIFSFWAARFFEKKFGGLTGDNLGAITEMSEVLFLFMMIGPYPTNI